MYDIHCHILYNLDDGAQSLEEAVEMISIAANNGTKGIVATPHTNVPGSYRNYWDRDLLDRVKILRQEVINKGINVQIFCGQEIFYTPETPKLLENGDLITLNHSKYPLVEFDFNEFSETVYTALRKLVACGYTPVLAHPERYGFISEDSEAASKVKSIGCLLQVNKGSLEGNFGDAAFFSSRDLLASRLADVVASDAHSPYMRTTNMIHTHELISEEYSFDYAEYLLLYNPGKILQNKDAVLF